MKFSLVISSIIILILGIVISLILNKVPVSKMQHIPGISRIAKWYDDFKMYLLVFLLFLVLFFGGLLL